MKMNPENTTQPTKGETWITDDGNDCMVRCPKCGKVETLDGFDVLGADDGCVFCTDCHQEIDMNP